MSYFGYWIFLFSVLLGLSTTSAHADALDKAKTMWRKLLWSTPQPEDSQKLALMVSYIVDGKPVSAAEVLTPETRFLNNPVFDIARRWSQHEGKATEPLNDMSAMVIGLVKDGADFRSLLTGDFLYVSSASFKVSAVSLQNNNHYQDLFNLGVAGEALVRRSPQWPNQNMGKETASGVLTTRGFASTYLNMGTNRAAIAYGVYEKFLCRKIEQIADASLSDAWIGRDVEREPGGNPQEYLTRCAGCHTEIDSQRGAFAYLDFNGGALKFLTDVAPKLYRDDNVNYSAGYRPRNAKWRNLVAVSTNSNLGWTGNVDGEGVNAFGMMVSNSEGFVDCMVETVFKQVCGRPSNDDEKATTLKRIGKAFVEKSYNLKKVYEEVVALNQCSGS